MEYWNVGIMGLAELDLFYVAGKDQEIKSAHHPLFIRFIQYSIFPVFHYSMGSRTANTTPLG